MALAVTNNMNAFGTGDTGELLDVSSGPGWYDLDNQHGDFGRLSTMISVTDDYYEGAGGVEGCIGMRASGSGLICGMVYSDGSTTIDMSGTMFVRVTVKYSEVSKMGTKAQGGIQVIVVDSGGYYRTWYVGGKDTYFGDWEQYLVDISTTADSESSTPPTMTDIVYVGVCSYYPTAPARAENQFIDAQWYGDDPSITVYGAVAVAGDGWSELEGISQAVTRRDGVIRLRNGIYEMRGGVKFGDAAGTNLLDFSDDQNAKLRFPPAPVGSLDSVSGFLLQGNGTGDTEFSLGSLVGGAGLLGGSIFSTDVAFTFDSATNEATIESCDLQGVSFEGAGVIAMDNNGNQTMASCQLVGCDQFDPGAAVVRLCNFIATASTAGAVLWNESIDIQNCNFIANTVGAAIEMPSAAGTPYSYDALLFSGNTYDVLNSSGSAISINKNNGSNPTTYEGSAVTFLGVSVDMQVTVKDEADDSAIEGAAVTIKVGSGGSYPFEGSVTITRIGSVATVAHTAHGLGTGQKVIIDDADQNEYNRIKTITKIDADSYSFVVSGTPDTPATGTITSTAVLVDGVTNVSGVISDTRSYPSNQPYTGLIQKGSSVPIYKARPVSGTLDKDIGESLTILLTQD